VEVGERLDLERVSASDSPAVAGVRERQGDDGSGESGAE